LRTPAQNLRTAELLPWFCAMVAECPRRGVRMGRALASGHPPCGARPRQWPASCSARSS